MGIFDKAKDAAMANKDKLAEGLDKANEMAQDKLGDKLGDHADKLDMVTDKAKEALEGTEGEGEAAEEEAPAEEEAE